MTQEGVEIMGVRALGMKVVIIEDCRPGHMATGQTATYEGDFPVDDSCAFPNPRMRLQDGSVIWGCECWWKPVEEAGPLPQMQQELEKYKEFVRGLLKEITND